MLGTVVNLPGYHVTEELYNGSRTLVYRGYREADSLPVVIKLLKNPYPGFNELLSFRNQYTITKNLRSSLIVQTYSLETYQNGYALIMEDFGGISLKQWGVESQKSGMGGSLELLQEFLAVAIALCDTLDLLYREQIIHQDIKPSNILINPETKQVKLIDFSIASLLLRETQTLINPNVLEGTLAYISPEQTGRINRGIDYRTDFYSLGVTFYELLTGKLPFQSHDVMELVHSHIAKTAPLIHDINPSVPTVISEIIKKLMAKNAEARYQSALGLKYDLEDCLEQLQRNGTIESFEIAQRDVCDRFIIPDKLYGREAEVATLLQAFEQVSQGATEMMLIAGFSGIGKTAVVNEVHKPIVRQRGYFIKGKFDQFQRNIPFSAFVQAFRDLIGQLLTESDPQIQAWKHKLLTAFGENGQVIIEVIPELENIIGKQPPALELSGTAAENRFNLLFQRFTQVFTSLEHPLVIFLDDLQWADSASLKLIQLLMADTSYLLLIGAYRDHEVTPAHPLMLTLERVNKTAANLNTINLQPLSQNSLNNLVADTLNCTVFLAQPLTELVYRKTQGNPFFATQFLKALYQDKLIQFNRNLGCWQCDIAQVTQLAVTDDVVAFMALQLQRLPLSTQNILQLTACIGNQFDLGTLAIVSEQLAIEVAANLWKALQEGLIVPISHVYRFYVGEETQAVNQEIPETAAYKFLHDRVQQAAYSLIPDDRKPSKHLQIGRLLLKRLGNEAQGTQLFTLVNQLNMGRPLITATTELVNLAQLNLAAAQKARLSAAYEAALNYANMGINLLTLNVNATTHQAIENATANWAEQYHLLLPLHHIAAESAFLQGEFSLVTELVETVFLRAKNVLDRVPAYETQIQVLTTQKNYLQAIATGLQILAQLGVKIPANPSQLQLLIALVKTKLRLQGKSINTLLQLPQMTNPQSIAAMRILNLLTYPAYFASKNMFAYLAFVGVQKSLKEGNSIWTARAYSLYSIILADLKDFAHSYQLGQLSLRLFERMPNLAIEAKVKFDAAFFSQPCIQSLRDSQHLLQSAIPAALASGDLVYAGLCYVGDVTVRFHLSEPLEDLLALTNSYRQAIAKMNDQSNLFNLDVLKQYLTKLQVTAPNPHYLFGDEIADQKVSEELIAAGATTFLNAFYGYKLALAYYFEDIPAALNYADHYRIYESGNAATYAVIPMAFFEGLIRLAAYQISAPPLQKKLLQRVAEIQKILARRARFAPVNAQSICLFLAAERYRVLGQNQDASDLYDRVIIAAKSNGDILEEALANELAAKLYLNWDKSKVAAGYMQEAYYCYAKWGAKAKTDDLEQRYPQLLKPILEQRQFNLNPGETITSIAFSTLTSSAHNSSVSSISDTLDFTSVLKAAQTISSSIELDELITSLTKIILENSGAKKSILMLPQENIWQVRAITWINHQDQCQNHIQTILEPKLLDTCPDIPLKIINYVKNTQQTIVIDNCQTDIPGLIGEYMLQHQPQSVLCTPMINQGNLVGILYLENQLTTGVFTNERLKVISLLSYQAAISLENARLYQQSQQALQDLQQAQLQIIQSEKMSALGNLVAGVAHEMNNPLGFIYASLQQAKPTLADIIEHLQLYQQSLPNPDNHIQKHAKKIDLEYSLEDLPKMLDSMVMACDRLNNISTSLRTFSRADKDYKVKFNLHEGIDSTILILKHRLKANEQRPAVQVTTNYGDLPLVNCFPGQLNQVFMNILANAIDALEEANIGKSFADIKTHPNHIKITTSILDKYVKISIADNGKGMSAEIQQKIFDHLFTTKVVGKGTGLGLAIARQIVEETHGGILSCHSVLGTGTEFVIKIPL
ncbi:MAG: AAA family ATPase [Nostoc sp. TH1S01]|nr:AAA family ATPase [Nostoc sp. TH1S01]